MSHIVVDPIYGQVKLLEHEKQLVELTFFQRLNYIKQLGIAFCYYPAATHTRLGHCLGTMHVADLMYEVLVDKNTQLKERSGKERHLIANTINRLKVKKHKLLVRLAALLHDVGHGPFSHSFEEVLKRNPQFKIERKDLLKIKRFRIIKEKNKALWKRYVPKLLSKHEHFTILVLLKHREEIEGIIPSKIDFEDVLRILTGKIGDDEVLEILSTIISGDVDADRVDYLLRDTHHVGFKHSGVELHNIINQLRLIYFKADHKRWIIGVSRDGVLSVEGLLIARKYHYDRIATDENIRKYEQVFVRKLEDALTKLPSRKRIVKITNFFIEGEDNDVINFLEHSYGKKFYELMNEAVEYRSIFDAKWMQFTPQIRYDLYMIWRIGEKKKLFERYFEDVLEKMWEGDFLVDLYFHGKLPTFLTVSAIPGFRFLYDYSVIIGNFPLVIYENGGVRIYTKSKRNYSKISKIIEKSIFAEQKNQRLLYNKIFEQLTMKLTSDIRKSYVSSRHEELRRCKDLDLLMSLLFFVHDSLTSNNKLVRAIRKNLIKNYGKENKNKIDFQIERRKQNLGIRTSIYKFIYNIKQVFSYGKKMTIIRVPATGSRFYYCKQAYEDLQTLRALGLITEVRHLHNPKIKPDIKWHTPMFYYSITRSGESFVKLRNEMQKMVRVIQSKMSKLQTILEKEIIKMAKL
jgi:HD superfamily phosphohydrolase